MRRMHSYRRNGAAVPVRQIEAIAGVGDERAGPAEIGAGADRGRDAHIGGDAEDNEMLRPHAPQFQIQIGPDERRIDALGDQRLAGQRCETVAEPVSGQAGAQSRQGLDGIVTHMDDREARSPLCRQQPQAVAIQVLVPPARPWRSIERTLHIDAEQHGGLGFCSHHVPRW